MLYAFKRHEVAKEMEGGVRAGTDANLIAAAPVFVELGPFSYLSSWDDSILASDCGQ